MSEVELRKNQKSFNHGSDFIIFILMTAQDTKRIQSIDILRGIIMVIMALDHVRDYFGGVRYDPTDLQQASTVLFFTRWVTNFCAPVFVFLSGTSVFLSMSRGKTMGEQSRQLLSRGLWLVVLEVTVVRFGWLFDLNYQLVVLQVIWAIGVSMVCLAGLMWLPRGLVLAIGLVMIAGHNMLDSVHPSGRLGIVWDVLHLQGPLIYHGRVLMVIYPLLPWIGVMAAGYCFGEVFMMDAGRRNKWLYGIGGGAIALFLLLRGLNVYGDPVPWERQATVWRTVLSFIKCNKYPPSLLYLLMTLGPAIVAMPLLERMGSMGNVFKVFGRVPLFYYILHIYLIHILALAASYFFNGNAPIGPFSHPEYPLGVVYAVWVAVVVILYLPCLWFMRIKMSHRKWWLSYL